MKYAILVVVLLLCGCTSDEILVTTTTTVKACPADAKICPDGSTVVRVPPDCSFQPCPPEPARDLRVSTDKAVYRSHQDMWINLTVTSDTGGPAGIWVHGINARNRERLSIRDNYTLEEGENVIKIKYRTPSCTGCAGISPGDYTVTAEVTVYDKNLTANTTVNIQQ